MAKKQAIINETAASASSARAAKPMTPRVKAAQHSKVVSSEPVAAPGISEAAGPENASEAIARIAYSFWEARGYQNGFALEDWVRAEHEYRQRVGAARL